MEDIMKLATDPTDEEKEEMRKEEAIRTKQAMDAVFEQYRKMGYNV